MFDFPFAVTFNSSLQIKGLLLTAIREHGRLDHDNDIMGELLPLDYYWLKPNHLKKSVCANSVSHR